MATTRHTPTISVHARRVLPNHWDGVAFVLIIALFALAGYAAAADERAADDRDGRPDLARSGRPAGLCAADHAAHDPGAARLAPLHLHLRDAGGQGAAGGDPAGAGPRHPAVGADPGIHFRHHRRLHGAVPGQPAGGRAGGHLRHLHEPGLEHGVQLLSGPAHPAQGPGRGRPQLPPLGLAAVLARRGAVRHARAGVEHDDVDVRRLVLRRGRGGDQRRQHHDPAARASAPTSPSPSRGRTWRRSAGPC